MYLLLNCITDQNSRVKFCRVSKLLVGTCRVDDNEDKKSLNSEIV